MFEDKEKKDMDAKRAREAMEQLPVKEVEKSLSEFLKPVLEKIPDKRLRESLFNNCRLLAIWSERPAPASIQRANWARHSATARQ